MTRASRAITLSLQPPEETIVSRTTSFLYLFLWEGKLWHFSLNACRLKSASIMYGITVVLLSAYNCSLLLSFLFSCLCSIFSCLSACIPVLVLYLVENTWLLIGHFIHSVKCHSLWVQFYTKSLCWRQQITIILWKQQSYDFHKNKHC